MPIAQRGSRKRPKKELLVLHLHVAWSWLPAALMQRPRLNSGKHFVVIPWSCELRSVATTFMPSQHVLVVGTGAIGAFFASRLASVSGIKVSTICRSNFQAIKTGGIRVTSPLFGESTFQPHFTFASPEEARQATKEESLSWNYLLLATKVLPELGDASTLLEGLVGHDSSIVVMQNGLAIEEPYWKKFPCNPIISSVTR